MSSLFFSRGTATTRPSFWSAVGTVSLPVVIVPATPEARYTALRAYLQEHGVESTVGSLMDGFRFLNPGQFNRDFRSMIYIPNERRELWVQKIDQNGTPLEGGFISRR